MTRDTHRDTIAAAMRGGGAIDLEDLFEQIGGDRILLAELVAIFLEQSPLMLSDVRRDLQANDADGVERAAHRLRGSVATFGARAAADAAFALEQMGREGRLEPGGALLADLDREMALVHAALAPFGKEATS